ncbi:MAG: glycosyltransferase family 39 protein [Candidatus Auribacterota bacterium]
MKKTLLKYSVISIIFVIGVIYRVHSIMGTADYFTSDTGVLCLMAKHIRLGLEFPVFWYGHSYLGALPAYFLSVFFWIFGTGLFAFKIYALFFSVLSFILIVLMARSLFDKRVALLCLAFLAIPPHSLIVTIAYGGYQAYILLGIVFLWILGNYVRTEKRLFFFLTAVVAGFGWYSHPMFIYFILLFFVTYLIRSVFSKESTFMIFHIEKIFVWCILFLVGAIPYFIGLNRNYHYYNPLGNADSEIFSLLTSFVWAILFKIPHILSFDRGYPAFRVINSIFYIFLFIAVISEIVQFLKSKAFAPKHLFFLFFITTIITFSYEQNYEDLGTSRHLMHLIILLPIISSLLVQKFLGSKKVLMAGIILLLSLIQVCLTLSITKTEPNCYNLIETLRKKDLTKGFADFWLAYKLTFLADESVILSPLWGADRYEPYTYSIINSAQGCYIFDLSDHIQSARCEEFERTLSAMKTLSFTREEYEPYRIFSGLQIIDGNANYPVKYFNPVYEDEYWEPLNPEGKPNKNKNYSFTIALPKDVYNFEFRVKYNGECQNDVYCEDGAITVFDQINNALIGRVQCKMDSFADSSVQVYRFKAYCNPLKYVRVLVSFFDANLELESMLIY